MGWTANTSSAIDRADPIPKSGYRSFEDFFEREYSTLVRALIPGAHSLDAAEEAAQDSMRRVFERWRRVERMDSPIGYAYVTGRNSLRRRFRRDASRLVVDDREGEPRSANATDVIDPARVVATRDQLFKALAQLSPAERDALLLVAYLGLEVSEAARTLKIKRRRCAVDFIGPESPSGPSSRRNKVTSNGDDIAVWLRRRLDDFEPRDIDPRQVVAHTGRRRRRRLGGYAFAAAAVATAIALILAVAPSDEPLGPPTVRASAQLTMPGRVLDSASEGGTLWVLACDTSCNNASEAGAGRGDLVKVDNATGVIEETIPVNDPTVSR